MDSTFRIGTAGWSLPKDTRKASLRGTILQQYGLTFNAVEINSSFYRNHKTVTYRRWADSVRADFRFSVKLSKLITHEKRLKATGDSNLVSQILAFHQISLVKADPQVVSFQAKDFQNSYDENSLKMYAQKMKIDLKEKRASWCIFDNTMFGEATRDAIKLQSGL